MEVADVVDMVADMVVDTTVDPLFYAICFLLTRFNDLYNVFVINIYFLHYFKFFNLRVPY